jgi:16S rRNA (cytosine1402-N4)-methyltransferase
LGVSSMQMDDASRGFTYKRAGPLDMRMEKGDSRVIADNHSNNDSTVVSAYELLTSLTVPQLTAMLRENSDEPYADVIARAILGQPQNNNKGRHIHNKTTMAHVIPSTTVELATVVREAVRPLLTSSSSSPSAARPKTSAKSASSLQQQQAPPQRPRGGGGNAAARVKKELDSTVARVMQAIRIAVNQEFESLEQLLDDLPYLLAPQGRAVILTFHSGEDRRVKKAFKEGYKRGIYSSWSRDVVRPSAAERRDNPRSSCCKLRWVVRSDESAMGAAAGHGIAAATDKNNTTTTSATGGNENKPRRGKRYDVS